ncbi:MAG: hypothetical protein ACREX8_16705, partial [Gammaproteobacteria bacterium]
MTTAADKVDPQQRALLKQTAKEKMREKLDLSGRKYHMEGSDFELQASKMEAIDVIKLIKDPGAMKVAQANSLSSTIGDLGKFEFVKVSSSGLVVLAQGKRLKSKAGDMKGLLGQLLVCYQEILAADGQKLSKPLGTYITVKNEMLDLIEEISGMLEDIALNAQEMLEVKAIEAWVNKHPDKVSLLVDVLKGVGSAAVATGTEAMPPQFKPLAGAAGFLKDVAYAGIDKVNEARQVANYQKVHQKGAGFTYLNDKPAAMAELVAESWKTK